MKITKLIHSCLLVEVDDRVALFDPGAMSRQAVMAAGVNQLDEIIVTHEHFDHMDSELIKDLLGKFPGTPVIAPGPAAQQLQDAGVAATTQPIDGIEFFPSPHESVEPLANTPEQNGINYLGLISHPGDSHSFMQTMPILALPITAPWGSAVAAINLAIELKPDFVIPIHDWHWSDEARQQTYDTFKNILSRYEISFISAVNGQSVELNLQH